MKRVFITITILVFFSYPCLALTFMGPPASNIKQGQLALGGEFSFGQMDIDLNGFAADIESNAYFGKLLFGIADNFEISGLAGARDIEEDAVNGFSSGSEFAWGFGTKAKLSEYENLSAGISFHITSMSGKDTIFVVPYLIEGDFEAYEMQLGFGVIAEAGDLFFYGGPFLHFLTGDFEESLGIYSIQVDIEQKSELGGYVGLGLNIANNFDLAAEYQMTSDAWAAGISLIHRFGETRKTARSKSYPKFQTNDYVRRSPASTKKLKQVEYEIKRNANGEIIKDENGNFVFFPVEGNEK